MRYFQKIFHKLITKIRKRSNEISNSESTPINCSLLRSIRLMFSGRGGFFLMFINLISFLLEDILSNKRTPFYEKHTTDRSINRISIKI